MTHPDGPRAPAGDAPGRALGRWIGTGIAVVVTLVFTGVVGGLLAFSAATPHVLAVGGKGVWWITTAGAAAGLLFGILCCVLAARGRKARARAASSTGTGDG